MKIVKAENVKRTRNWRILIYGKAGLGKTSLIRHLKGKTIVLSMDNSHKVLEGAENVDIRTIDDDGVISFDRKHPSEDIEKFITEVDEVISNYDNLVIDNVSSLQSDWFIEQGRKSKNGISNELQHYNQWTNYFLRILTAIYNKPINIYITAWEDTHELNLETGQIITQYVPQIRNSVLNQLLGLTDVVGRILVNAKTGARGLILEGSEGTYAKNRLDSRTACKIEELFDFEGGD